MVPPAPGFKLPARRARLAIMDETVTGPEKKLTPAARRALEEAAARRKAIDRRGKDAPKEIDGRGGLEPTRYDDWEVKGLASDF